MKHLILMIAILTSGIAGQSDVSIDITQEQLIGEWIRTTEINLGSINGMDMIGRETTYKIGITSIDRFLYQTQYRIIQDKPLALNILYPRGGTSEGCIFQMPAGEYEEYNSYLMEVSLNYKYFWLDKQDTVLISFKIPRNSSADTLMVTIKSDNKSETFGLKKRR